MLNARTFALGSSVASGLLVVCGFIYTGLQKASAATRFFASLGHHSHSQTVCVLLLVRLLMDQARGDEFAAGDSSWCSPFRMRAEQIGFILDNLITSCLDSMLT